MALACQVAFLVLSGLTPNRTAHFLLGILALFATSYLPILAMSWIEVPTEAQRQIARHVGLKPCWPVKMAIEQNGVATGSDVGVVYFENDLMQFRGCRTRFAVSGAQYSPQTKVSGTDPVLFEVRWNLRFALRVSFQLQKKGPRGWPTVREFKDAAEAWRKVEGDAISAAMPTLQIQPELRPQVREAHRRGVLTASWVLAFLTVMVCVAATWMYALVPGIASLALFAIWLALAYDKGHVVRARLHEQNLNNDPRHAFVESWSA